MFQVKNMIVYVEKKVLEDPAILSDENFGAITKKFCTFREGRTVFSCPLAGSAILLLDQDLIMTCFFSADLDDISNCVDFIICLGGDGTLLYASSLFQVVCRSRSSDQTLRHLFSL